MRTNPFAQIDAQTQKGRALSALIPLVGRQRGVASVRFTGDVADGETITVSLVGGEVLVYEFDTDATVTAGNIAVDVSGGVTPADAVTALLAVWNALGPGGLLPKGLQGFDVSTLSAAAGEIALVAVGAGGVGAQLATDAVNGEVEDVKGDAGHGATLLATANRAPSAEEVVAGVMHFAFPLTIVDVEVTVIDNTGAEKAWDGTVTVDRSTSLVSVDNSGAVDFAATDDVVVRAFGRHRAFDDAANSVLD